MDRKLTLETSEQSVIQNRKLRASEDPLGWIYTRWSSRFKCFLAYMCYTMNFQTILNFALILGEFGSVALVPYFILRIFIGIPCVLIKLLFDRFILGDISKAWTMIPVGKGLLYCSFGRTLYALLGNTVSIAYLIKYLTASLNPKLPWKYCEPSWSRENCYEGKTNTSAILKCLKTFSSEFCHSLNWETSATQYWKYVAAEKGSIKAISYSLFNLLLSEFFTMVIIYKGLKSFEKFFALFLSVPIMLGSLNAAVTFLIPEAICGSTKIWFTNFFYLFDISLWSYVFDETMLSLGLGLQTISFVSSHGRFFDDIFIDVLVVTFSDLFCCILLSTPILSIVGAKFPCEVPRSSKRLFDTKLDVFVALSDAILLYPTPTSFWAFLFYLEFFVMAMSNQIILVLAVCETIHGFIRHKISFFIVSLIFCILLFLVASILIIYGMAFDFLLNGFSTMMLFLSTFTLMMFYGYPRLIDDFHFVMGYYPPLFLRIFWIAAFFISIAFIVCRSYYMTPEYSFGESIYYNAGLPLVVYIISAVVEIIIAASKKKVMTAFQVSPDWGPQNPILKKSRIVFNSRTVTKEFMYRQELNKKPVMKRFDFSQQNIVQVI